jgi:oxygen-independent coproporphyrinogen III oxidase
MASVALGVYISVPFCRTKCSYCNFASDVFSKAVFEKYVDRVCADIKNASQAAAEIGGKMDRQADSIYFGGGTPTVLNSEQIERIFAALRRQFEISSAAEITIECAPGTLSDEMVAALLRSGVNRISLGVQSFVDQEAAAVGRLHKREMVLQDISRLRSAGISNINIDLIAGLPHQTAESWEFSLLETIATEVPHVSVYMLEVDDESRLGRELLAGGTRYHAHFVPDEEAIADFYLAACERLETAGISQYEISNFARGDFESRHNLKYWMRQPYFGFGVDAHSMLAASSDGRDSSRPDMGQQQNCKGHGFSRADTPQKEEPGFSPRNNDAVRFSTSDSLEQYIAGSPLQSSRITREMALEETFFLGLRLNRGVDLRRMADEFGEALASAHEAISDLIACQLLERTGNCIRLTPKGRLLSNEVFERFIGLPDIKAIEHSTISQR